MADWIAFPHLRDIFNNEHVDCRSTSESVDCGSTSESVDCESTSKSVDCQSTSKKCVKVQPSMLQVFKTLTHPQRPLFGCSEHV